MGDIASNVEHGEFWRPPMETRREAVPQVQSEGCARCGTDFVPGSRFCHVCGAERQPEFASPRFRWARFLEIRRMQDYLGLPIISLVFFIVGVICALAAIGTGLVFTANTVLDWQAVQVWRIEWLLAAVVAFLAAILLTRAGGARQNQ